MSSGPANTLKEYAFVLISGRCGRCFGNHLPSRHLGISGETYNIASDTQLEVRESAQKIQIRLGRGDSSSDLEEWTESVPDRPFNDSMYWTDGSKLEELGWRQRTDFDEGLQATIRWNCAESEDFWLKR
ncbi:hypothetical protein N7492_001102 [Penicillium capsulatum]|uniref:Uncharacterized protein n=1 Tax=Penicillium capsulatum TaxID=69766 RepID=A0A9W9IU21_9EURO|nr:hypothetical protein N7492_001102 [Penicillium capsulatum]KAJ6129840.1 hypothetical protein N7512_002620 [Penicillium capsulatum]